MSRLLDKPEADVIGQLVAADLIYKEPNSQQYQTADEYLSGNVRQKLKDAQGATLLDPAYERNVKALQAVQPEIVPFIDIDVRLGQTWVPQPAPGRATSSIRRPRTLYHQRHQWPVERRSAFLLQHVRADSQVGGRRNVGAQAA
jgi:hypothetical protein